MGGLSQDPKQSFNRHSCAGVEGAVVVGKLLERNAEADYGYNAASNTYQDLVKAGIIDPLKVRFTLTGLG